MNAPINGSRFIDPAIFGSNPAQAAIADSLKSEEGVSLASLKDAYAAAGKDVERRNLLKAMIEAARLKPSAGVPIGAVPARQVLRVVPAEVKTYAEAVADKVLADLEKEVVGQPRAKQALHTILRASPPGRDDEVNVIAFPGPSGVGKTAFALGITRVLHGAGVEPITLEGSKFKNKADLAVFDGAPPMYAGHGDPVKLGKENVEKTFKGKKPIVIFIDEIDDIAEEIREEFWTKLNSLIDAGKHQTNDSIEPVDYSGALVIIAGNPGMGTLNGRTGEAADAHFLKAFEEAIPSTKMLNRIGRGNIVPFEFLEKPELREIADTKFMGPDVAKERSRNARERGVDLSFDVDPAAMDLLVSLTFSRVAGARILKEVARKILRPQIREAMELAGDDDRLKLVVKPGFSDLDRNKWLAKFEATNGMPNDFTIESCPFTVERKQAHRSFQGYEGVIPMSPLTGPHVHASGAFAGDGFLLYNQGESDSVNELIIVRDAPSSKNDKLRAIALPPALADANLEVRGAALSEHEMLVTAVHIEGDEAKTIAFLYDDKKKSWTDCGELPIALVGATLAPVGGKALLVGGRPVFHDGNEWSVELQAADDDAPNANPNNGVASQGSAFLFDPATKQWEALDSTPQEARSGIAHATVGDKVYLLGGDSSAQHPSGTRFTVATKIVDVFDLASKTFSAGPELPYAVAHGLAVPDRENGRLLLLGGVDYIEAGARSAPKQSLVSIALDGNGGLAADATMKVRRDVLPSESAQLAAIARGPNFVVGPFLDADDMPVFAEMV